MILALGAGIAYAAWQQLDSGRVEANKAILDSLPLYPGAREIQRITQTATGEDALPVPDEIVTSALYAPPADATQEDIVAFYVESLQPEWEPRTRVVTASGEDVDPEAAPRPRSASTSRGTTTASASSRTAWLRATSASPRSPSPSRAATAPCRGRLDHPSSRPLTADEKGRVKEPPAEH